MKTILVNLIEYDEFDKLIRDNYHIVPHGFTFLLLEEKGNDTVYLYHIKKEPLDEYFQKRLFESAHTLLTDLCNRDLISEGYYLVEVSW